VLADGSDEAEKRRVKVEKIRAHPVCSAAESEACFRAAAFSASEHGRVRIFHSRSRNSDVVSSSECPRQMQVVVGHIYRLNNSTD